MSCSWFLVLGSWFLEMELDLGCWGDIRGRILKDNAQVGLFPFEDHLIGFDCIGNREPVRRQCLRFDRPQGTQVEKRFQVSLLGPADISDRVVVTLLFELRVVPTGPYERETMNVSSLW